MISNKQNVIQLTQELRYKEAQAMCKQVCKKHPKDAEAWFLLGAINGQLCDYKGAESSCRRALSLQPNHAVLHYNLAIAMAQQGKLEKAINSFKQAILLNPQYTEAYLDMANALQSLGNVEQAIISYKHAIQLQPDLVVAYNNLGDIYHTKGQLNDAETNYTMALKIKSDFIPAISGLAKVYITQIKLDDAQNLIEPVIDQITDGAELYVKLGVEFMLQGEHKKSLSCLKNILSLQPDHIEARWAHTILQIPAIYESEIEPALCRSNFSLELDKLKSWLSNNGAGNTYQAIGNQQPFFLAYQEENNRDLLAKHGEILATVMQKWSHKQGYSDPTIIKRDILKIGIVSAQLIDHSVWDAIVKGWFQHIDQKRFELHTFHISSAEDQETNLARTRSTFFIQGNKDLQQWTEVILKQQIDVLIYPEIGLDQITEKLACLRLAPVQVATWGHPETTGLPTIDYYLSAENFEPHNAQDNYTEQLIPLPNLGCYYHPLPITSKMPDWSELSIDPTQPILLCPGMPFKYAPKYDWIFVEIAKRLNHCQFVFFQHHSLGKLPEMLRNRLDGEFARNNMSINDYVKFISWQKKPEFYGLMERSTVFMDTIGFSGFNTAMQATECGLPIVCKEGAFMRGRLASGILRRMKITELITEDEDEYISLVVKIVQDTKYRNYLHQLIKTNRHVLFDDLTPIRAMEKFFSEVVTDR